MLFLSEDEVKKHLSIRQAITAVENAQAEYARGLISLAGRTSMEINGPERACIFLPARHHRPPYYGFKHAGSFPDNHQKGLPTVLSQICLYSAHSGELLAVIEANHLTALKTGAASAVATKYLAGKHAGILAVIGTGIQARTQLLAISMVRELTEVRLFDSDPGRAKDFALWAGENLGRNIRIETPPSAGAAVRGADIIVTATSSMEPVFSGQDLAGGVHVNAVGSFTPEMQEVDAHTMRAADLVFADNEAECWQVAGDLLKPLAQGLIGADRLSGEIGQLVSGALPGRDDDKQITLYESVGFAPLDLACAIYLYEQVS